MKGKSAPLIILLAMVAGTAFASNAALMAAPADRPQHPVRPYPYREIEASYDNPKRPGVHLAGTLTVPQGGGRFPTALLITGSGRQDRDETIFGHKPFLVLADYLTRRGIAVLRVDDRGVGGSTGAGPDDTSRDFATDVEAGLAWLKRRPEVDTKRIGLVGHSEGGMIAPIVARDNEDVAFAILWAGNAVNGAEMFVEQVRAVTAANGASADAAAVAAKQQRTLAEAILAAGDGASAYRTALNILMSEGQTEEQAAPRAKFLTNPWFRNFLAYDPAPTLRSLRIPVLALFGTRDVHVLASQNAPPMGTALAGNPKAKVVVLTDLNHLFQRVSPDGPQDYGAISQTLDPVAMKLMGDWIIEATRR